jgi:hypothetical protein
MDTVVVFVLGLAAVCMAFVLATALWLVLSVRQDVRRIEDELQEARDHWKGEC